MANVFETLASIVLLVVPLILGVSLGHFLRKRRMPSLSRLTFGIILVLIFSLGFNMGSNGESLGILLKGGFNIVVITLLAVLFSILFVKAVRRVASLS